MASNAIPEKSQKPKPAAGILGYFQKKPSPSGTENIPIPIIDADGGKDSGLKKSEETSPGLDKENKSKLVVKMKPRGAKKKRKKIEMEENSSEDDIELDVILKKKKKFRLSSGEESRPSSSEPTLDIEKVVTVPKPEPEPIEISSEEVLEDPGQSKTPESKPKKNILSFFQKVTKEERLHKVEKDNSCVEVRAIVHESPENKKSPNLKKHSPKLKSPNISKKPRKSRKSNVSISAAETDKIELLEVEEIVEKTKEEEKKVLIVDEKNDVEKNLESEEVVRKISNNLFRKNRTKRKIVVKCKNDEESDDSVNMESLQNSPVKNLRSATNSPLKKSAKIPDLGQIESPDEKMDCRESKEEEKSEEPSKEQKKIPKDEKLKNMLSVLQSVEDLEEDSDRVTPLIATPKNSRTPRAKKKKQVSDKQALIPPEPQIEESDIPESPSVGRRSGRIARRSSVTEERKKIQEEQERRLEESDRKIELERKIRNAAVAKQKKLLAGKSSESQDSPGPDPVTDETDEAEADSDCQIEEEVVASPRRKKTVKPFASIFVKNKKADRPAEDPAVVAARKAFLMSAAPETLRTQMCRAGEEEREERGVVWPGSASLPSHTGLDTANLPSQPGQLAGQWRFSGDLQTSLDLSPPVLNLVTTPEDQSGPTSRLVERMSEASVLATVESRVENKTWPGLEMFKSLIERKVNTETLEVQAREAKLTVSEVKARDQKRGRAKRRRSRRSVEVARPSDGGGYQVEAGSGLVWTSKYEPRCGAEILGNCDEVARLRQWLTTWTSGAGGGHTRGGSTSTSGSTSELTTDSEFESDVELSETSGGNTALLVGPTGCGKTATVFALATELGFNVLEVNASRNRTGKQVRTEDPAEREMENILIYFRFYPCCLRPPSHSRSGGGRTRRELSSPLFLS